MLWDHGAVGSTDQYADGSQVHSVQRAAALLTCFVDVDKPLTLSELARRTGLTTSTAHRLLRTLVGTELLTYDPDTERYWYGSVLTRLARGAFQSSGALEAREILQQLVDDTGESASLGIREQDHVLVVVSAHSGAALRFTRPPGSHVPLHASAMGKALLAFGPEPIETAVKPLGTLERLTARSITARKALATDLHGARDRGYTIVDEEQHLGVFSIGVPVRDARGVAYAAVALQGPVTRLRGEHERAVQHLQRAAAKLEGIPIALLATS